MQRVRRRGQRSGHNASWRQRIVGVGAVNKKERRRDGDEGFHLAVSMRLLWAAWADVVVEEVVVEVEAD